MVRTIFLALAAAASSLTSAHFVLNWPPTAGFIDDDEPNAPCGGAEPTFNESVPELQVDRFAVAILSTHPAGSWRLLASTNTDAPYNFTELVPTINSTGAGKFCLPSLHAPSDFAGKNAVLQVIDYSSDGTLYQCAPVRFVTGSNNTAGPTCTNNTGFTAAYTSATTSNGSATSSSAASGTAAASSTSQAAAAATAATGIGSIIGLGLLAAGLAL